MYHWCFNQTTILRLQCILWLEVLYLIKILNFQILPNLDLAKYCVYAISGKKVINCLSEILSVMYGCCLNRVTNPTSMQSGSTSS